MLLCLLVVFACFHVVFAKPEFVGICAVLCDVCVCVCVCSCSKVLRFVVTEAEHPEHTGILGWVCLVRWRVKLSQITCSVEGGEKRFTMVNKKGISVLARTPFCFLFFCSFFFCSARWGRVWNRNNRNNHSNNNNNNTTTNNNNNNQSNSNSKRGKGYGVESLLADASAKIEQS